MNEEKNAEEIQETVQVGWSFSPRLCCFIRGGVKIDKTYLLIYGDSSIFGFRPIYLFITRFAKSDLNGKTNEKTSTVPSKNCPGRHFKLIFSG